MKRILVNCDCDNTYQDKKYGCNKRIANPMGAQSSWKEGRPKEARCTGCGKVHTVKEDNIGVS